MQTTTESSYVHLEERVKVPESSAIAALKATVERYVKNAAPLQLSVNLRDVRLPLGAKIDVPVRAAFEASSGSSYTVRIHAVDNAEFFPRFMGQITVTPLTRSSATIVLTGCYRVPLWILGKAIDITLFSGAARKSLLQFLHAIAHDIQESVRRSEAAYVTQH